MHETTDQTPTPPVTLLNGFLTVNGLVLLLGLIVSVLTILGFFRKMRREQEADAQARTDRMMEAIEKHNDSVEDRLKTVEVTIRDFMPRTEIEQKIEHEKNNRVQSDLQLKDMSERNSRDIVEIKVSVGKIEQQQVGMVTDMGEIKALVKEQGKDTKAAFDKMNDQLALIGRKVA